MSAPRGTKPPPPLRWVCSVCCIRDLYTIWCDYKRVAFFLERRASFSFSVLDWEPSADSKRHAVQFKFWIISKHDIFSIRRSQQRGTRQFAEIRLSDLKIARKSCGKQITLDWTSTNWTGFIAAFVGKSLKSPGIPSERYFHCLLSMPQLKEDICPN